MGNLYLGALMTCAILLLTLTFALGGRSRPRHTNPEPLATPPPDPDMMAAPDFTRCVAALLETQGLHIRPVPPGRDYGVDLIAQKGRICYAVQARPHHSPASHRTVQEVVAAKAMYHCHEAMVVSNGAFSSAARELARHNHCHLIDGAQLRRWAAHTQTLPASLLAGRAAPGVALEPARSSQPPAPVTPGASPGSLLLRHGLAAVLAFSLIAFGYTLLSRAMQIDASAAWLGLPTASTLALDPTSTVASALTDAPPPTIARPTRTLAAPTAPLTPPTYPRSAVAAPMLDLRAEPDEAAAIVAQARQGQIVEVMGLGASGSWLLVQLDDATRGWAIANQLRSDVPLAGLPIIEPTPTAGQH